MAGKKKTGDDLKYSDDIHKILIDQSPDVIVILQDGVYKYVNPAFHKTFGYTKKDIEKGLSVTGLVQEKDRKLVSKRYQDRLKGRKISKTFVLDMIGKNGKIIPCETSATRIVYENKPADLVIIRDITERVEVEKALKRSEEKYKIISELTSDYTYAFSVDSKGELEAEWVSGAFERITGYTQRGLARKGGWEKLILQEDLHIAYEQLTTLLKGKNSTVEYRIKTKRGEIKWMRDQAESYWDDTKKRVTHIYGAIQDISDRMEAIEALRSSEERFKSIFNNSQDGILLASQKKRTFLMGNETICGMLGYSAEEIKKLKIDDIHPKEDLKSIKNDFALMAQGKLKVAKTIPVMRKGGGIFYADIGASPIKVDGEIYMAGFFRDVTERVLTESALKESEKKFRNIVDSSPMGIHIYELKKNGDLIFIGYNEAANKMLGLDNAQFLGKPIEKAFPPLKGTEIPKRYKSAAAKGTPWRTSQIQYQDDQIVGAFEVYAFQTSPGRMAALFLEITDRTRTEKALADSEEKFRGIFEQTTDGIHLIDFEGRIIEWNRGCEEILGIKREDAIGKYQWEVVEMLRTEGRMPPHMTQAFKQIYLEFTRTGEISEFLEPKARPIKLLDGTEKVIETFTFPIKVENGYLGCSIIHDLTELKKAEADLQKKIEELISFNILTHQATTTLSIDTMSRNVLNEIVSTTDSDAAMLFLVDDGMLQLKGLYPRRKEYSRVGERSIKAGECLCGRALKGEFIYSSDIKKDRRCKFKDCFEAGFKSFAALPLIKDKETIGVLGIGSKRSMDLQDQTDFLETIANQVAVALQNILLHEQLKDHAEDLEKRVDERTEELETFAYSISHDLRAPLRAMEGFSNALLEDYGDRLDGMGEEYAKRIINASRRMDSLIHDILAYSRLTRTELDLRPVDLKKAVRESIDQNEHAIKDSRAKVEIKGRLPKVVGYEPILIQVLSNLISNAVKYVKDGKKPVVRISAEDGPDDKVKIIVEDNGIGIEKKHQDRIFRIFERLHGIDHYSGTGIGLAMVKKGMERLGGDVGLSSKPGKGTKFWITLDKAKNKTKTRRRERHFKGRSPL